MAATDQTFRWKGAIEPPRKDYGLPNIITPVARSEEMNGYTKLGTTPPSVTSDTTTAPDGATTADRLYVDNPASGDSYLGLNYTFPEVSVDYVTSLFVKSTGSSETDWLAITWGVITGDTTPGSIYFNTSTGAWGSGADGFNFVKDVSEGWWHIGFRNTLATDVVGQLRIYLAQSDGSATLTNSSATYEHYLWGVKIAKAARQTPYAGLPETIVDNQFDYSEREDFTAWSTARADVTATKTKGPHGRHNAQELRDSGLGGNNNSRCSRNVEVVSLENQCSSIFVKKGAALDWFYLRSGDFDANHQTYFDIVNGVVGATDTSINSGIDDYGEGWFRCWIVHTSEFDVGGNFFVYLAEANGDLNFTQDGTHYHHIYGAKSEPGDGPPTAYVPNDSTWRWKGAIEPDEEDSGVEISANSDTLTLTEYAATIATDDEITANSDTLTLTEYPAGIQGAVTVLANSDTLTLITFRAEIGPSEGLTRGGGMDEATAIVRKKRVDQEAVVEAVVFGFLEMVERD